MKLLHLVPVLGDPAKYNCTFPAMIRDWRTKWYQTTKQTDEMFPFGFVQVREIIYIPV